MSGFMGQGYLFDPNVPTPKRVVRSKSGWEEFQQATEVFAGFPSATQKLDEWVPGYYYPNGIQFATILVPVQAINEDGFLQVAESVVNAGSSITLFATVAGLPTAMVYASSQLLR